MASNPLFWRGFAQSPTRQETADPAPSPLPEALEGGRLVQQVGNKTLRWHGYRRISDVAWRTAGRRRRVVISIVYVIRDSLRSTREVENPFSKLKDTIPTFRERGEPRCENGSIFDSGH